LLINYKQYLKLQIYVPVYFLIRFSRLKKIVQRNVRHLVYELLILVCRENDCVVTCIAENGAFAGFFKILSPCHENS